MKIPHFHFYSKEEILSLTRLRRFETKLGERLQGSGGLEGIRLLAENSTARFVVFGVVEDIGVRGNYGAGGTGSAWIPFLSSFLNTQSNDFLSGDDIVLAGHFDFSEFREAIQKNCRTEDEAVQAYRQAVNMIDDEVEDMVRVITTAGKIPVLIGGGHNNAYPLIKGAAKGYHKAGRLPLAQINCINLDAHTDYRPLEGRHSGNAFRYAEEDGYLARYFILGLHENYLQQNVWMDVVNNPFIDFISFEDIFIHEKRNFLQAVAHATAFTEDNLTGIELDLDAVEYSLSSAATPCGISPLQARQYLSFCAADSQPAYLHICEGASRTDDGRLSDETGKLISYLVTDFLKGVLGK